MMILIAEKCPSDTVKWTYECFISILCGDDDTEVIIYSFPEMGRGVRWEEGQTRVMGHFNDDIKC